jgi:hypothetical protein
MTTISPDSTCAIRRRTSAIIVSEEISCAKLSTNRSVSSARLFDGKAITLDLQMLPLEAALGINDR